MLFFSGLSYNYLHTIEKFYENIKMKPQEHHINTNGLLSSLNTIIIGPITMKLSLYCETAEIY